MPNTREKLIELFRAIAHENCFGSIYNISDYLIANGVTVQEDCKACAEATQNCIVKLQEQIAELRSVQKWISVNDRLPEKTEHDWVLVQLTLVPEDAYGVPCVAELRNGEWYDADGCWIGTDPEGGCVIVTHWMPLPQPPKGE